jgi:hypothetical protein
MRGALASLLLLLAAVGQAAGQDRSLEKSGLPRSEIERLQTWIDHSETLHYTGDTRLESDFAAPASVVVWRGNATIAGRITGNLLVFEGDLLLEPGADVGGDVVVIGGRVTGAEEAVLAGALTAYEEGFGDEAVDRRRFAGRRAFGARDWNWADERSRDWGDSDFAVRLGENYNRVEGLPVHFGPEIRTGGPAPTRLEAYAIWRTEVSSPFDADELGYLARVEQWFDRAGTFRVGGTARSVVEPIERIHYSDVEASLAAVVLHEDLRDYFEREGWSAYARVAPKHAPFDVSLEYRDEEHATAPVRTPWTLFDRSDPWRPQPLAAEGDLRMLSARAIADLRDDDDFATRGWRFELGLDHALDVDLELPIASLDPDADPIAFRETFTTASVDLRRYQRVGRNATLALRGFGAGSLEESPLPPQFQHALGGAGSLPGYSTFSIACGARDRLVRRSGDDPFQDFLAGYGCDRMALVQAELRGGFDLHFDHGTDWRWDLDDPSWIVFFDAARGWAFDRDGGGRTDTGTLYDAGLGLLLGDLGIYGAIPLNADDNDVRLFIRLGPRF